MPDRCCVPGCRSNYNGEHYTRCFRFPKEPKLRTQWVQNINRKNWKPGVRSVVCVKHFHERDLSHAEIYKDKSGETKEFARKQPVLAEKAIPRKFKNQPKYLSSSPPQKRRDPVLRRKIAEEAAAMIKENKLQEDIIPNFETFLSVFESRLNNTITTWSFYIDQGFVLFYKIDHSMSIPNIKISIKINSSLNCQICVKGKILSETTTQYRNWSTVINLFEKYNNYLIPSEISFSEIVADCTSVLEGLQKYLETNNTGEEAELVSRQLLFLIEQFQLIFMKRKRYSVNMILNSFLIFMQSSKYYVALRENLLCLPHTKYLQQLTASCSISPNSVYQNKHFLINITKNLPLLEKHNMILQLDEIYVNSCYSYKSGTIYGGAENVNSEAKTIRAFLLSSPFGKFREVISLKPVKNITGDDLHEMTLGALQLLTACDIKVLVILSDNNKVNRKLFNKLTVNSESKHYFYMPNSTTPCFVLYDPVHIFKNIRNNWLNLNDPAKTFIFPTFEIGELQSHQREAKFSHIRSLYHQECNSILKLAPRLNYKSVFPSNFDRQKVTLVCNVFNPATAAALQVRNASETAEFVNIIIDWWLIVNNKNPIKGLQASDDDRVQYLRQFVLWLEKWKEMQNGICLTNDTYNAIHHSTNALIQLTNYCLSLDVQYLLLGKFQTDNLEKRFSN